MITRQTIDIIMAEARIEEVVGDFVHLKNQDLATKRSVPSLTRKHLRFLFLLRKGSLKILVLVRAEMS